MRTVTAHLLEYTLINHFDNNRSEMARRLGIRRTDFNRIYERCMSGDGGSHTTIEALLRLYFNEGYSLDEALTGYINAGGAISPLETSRKGCEDKSRTLRERLNGESKAADHRARVLRCAEQFMAQLERTFCAESCTKDSCSAACPCNRFGDFVEWMERELKRTDSHGS